MRGAWPVAAVRAAEKVLMARLPDGALMQRAAAGLATKCAAAVDRVYGARVVLLVGAGNNGGDALYAGARLADRGAAVTALLLNPDRAHQGGLRALRTAGGRAIESDPVLLRDADLVVDGIVGIGGRGGLRPDAARLTEAAAESNATLIAVDVPSGVDADTGATDGPYFDADLTVTFGCLKPGLIVGAGARVAGPIELVDIGLRLPPARIRQLENADVQALLAQPGPTDDKYTRGVVGVVAGSPTYTGAAVLCTGAALRTGAGMVRYSGRAVDIVRAKWPETVVNDGGPTKAGRVQAWVVGPGLGTDEAAERDLRDVLTKKQPSIVDADGITLLARNRELIHDKVVITPHDREFERIAGTVDADRIGSAQKAAKELGCTVLLKGNATIVAAPDGRTYVNPTGTPALATAGTGDVLSGCIGTLLAAGLEPSEAAAIGAYLHGRAGQIAGYPLIAHDVLDALPAAIRSL